MLTMIAKSRNHKSDIEDILYKDKEPKLITDLLDNVGTITTMFNEGKVYDYNDVINLRQYGSEKHSDDSVIFRVTDMLSGIVSNPTNDVDYTYLVNLIDVELNEYRYNGNNEYRGGIEVMREEPTFINDPMPVNELILILVTRLGYRQTIKVVKFLKYFLRG